MERKIIIFLSIVFLLVTFRVSLFYIFKPPINEGNVNFIATLSSQPKNYNTNQSFSVNLPTGEFVFVKTKTDLTLNYGDRVKIIGTLKYKLLNNKRQILTMDYPQISLDDQSQSTFLAVVNFIRQQVSKTFYAYLPKDLAGLLLGIVIGVKTDLSPEFLKNLKLSGVTHVIAASGMNVTMVGGFFFYTLSLFMKRQLSIAMVILIIVFYGFLAGFQPSIIRACLMGIILFSSQILGRQNYSFYSLIIALFVMLLLWPQFLFDIGFQLSFTATLGLLFIPQMFGKFKGFLSEDLTTTLSAQLASLPILLISFGTYSVWSTIVNFLVLWTIPPLMILGGVAAVVSLVFAPLAKYILLLSLPLLVYFEAVIGYFASLPGILTFETFPIVFVMGYYFLLCALLIFVIKRRSAQSVPS